MKIGIYNPYLDALSGGERYVLTIASCLQSTHDVSIFWDDNSILTKAEQKLHIDLDKVQIVPNLFKSGILFYSAYARTKNYDLIIVLSDGSVPLIFSKHGIIHFQQPFQQVDGRSVLNRYKLSHYQTAIVNSQFTKKYIDKEYNANSQVLYPPVAVDQFRSGNKEKLIISVGRFHQVKKHEVMIATFKLLADKFPQWKLALIGGLMKQDNNYYLSLREQIGTSFIELLPNIDFTKLRTFYAKASIYWHAAGFGENEKMHPERLEHFGITPVEAMASGCIPIVYNGGGLPEIVTNGNNGFLWNSEEDLLNLTEKVITNNKQLTQIKTNAIVSAKRFSCKIFCRNIQKIVSSISLT